LRINRYIAQAGVASRRQAEWLILNGRVDINGVTSRELGYVVAQDDLVTVDGEVISQPQKIRLWKFNKPRGIICTNYDPEGRETLFELLPPEIGRVISVGRLDLDSEGLILLTNSGEVGRALELPINNLPRTYEIRVFGKPAPHDIRRIEQGIMVEGLQYQPAEIEFPRDAPKNTRNYWLRITLYEGKNREVRRIFDEINCPVNRLRRTHFGNIVLGNMELGECVEIQDAEAQLKIMLGQNFNIK
jgi:23S rRNA pseudouridine2605 synthase